VNGHDGSRVTRRQLLLGGVTVGAAAALAGADRRLGGVARRVPPARVFPQERALADASLVPPASVVEIDAPRLGGFVTRPDLEIPGLEVSLATGDVAPGLILAAPYNAPNNAPVGPLAADDSGSPLWQRPSADLIAADLRAQTYRGEPVLTWWEGKIELGHGVGSYVIADTSYRPIAHVNAGNGFHGDLHEFLLTDRGTALLTTYAVTGLDLSAVGGSTNGTIQDAIFQEVDVATGRVLLEWRSLDHIPLTDSYWPVGEDWDYVHLNSIAVDDDDNLLVSSRNTHTIYKIDRRTGEIVWRLGGKQSDFSIATGAGFAWQHDARRQADGRISMFDNGYQVSRALVLTVDEIGRRAAAQSSYRHPGNLHALSQGNAQLLPNGNVFVGWGAQPFVSEFTASGELIFDAQLPSGYITYRAYRAPWVGRGAGAPAVVAERQGDHIDVYVSWNGDTRVAYWQALAGMGRGDLLSLGAVRRTGFETGMRIPGNFTRISLAGIDPLGSTLTVTPATPV
jgi:hypothetical protein